MIKVDAMGDNCPIPVIKTKKAMQALTSAETIEVSVDNEIAATNVKKMAESAGATVHVEEISEKEFHVTVEMDGPMAGENAEDNEKFVVAIGSDRMGSGNDALGTALIKGFIFAVTQLDRLPDAMVFYNGGVTLTTEGSDSLDDIKMLEEEGVQILSCGTCLSYYEMTDKLAVGEVTNMYNIVETMASADKLVRP